MRIKSLTTSVAALAMVIAPVAAAANPVVSHSVGRSVRAAPADGDSDLAGGNGAIAAAFFVIALLAAALVLPDELDDGPNSP